MVPCSLAGYYPLIYYILGSRNCLFNPPRLTAKWKSVVRALGVWAIALASDVSRSVPQVVSEVQGPLTSTPKAFCVQTCPHTHLVPVENRVIQLINMLLEACVVFLLLASRASAQTVAISPSPLTGTEGSNCSVVGGGRTDFELTVDDSRIVTLAMFVGASVTTTGTQFVYGPLERSDSSKVFECDDSGGNRASATLVVHCE